MKKIICLFVLFQFMFMFGQFVWEDPLWVNQGAKIHHKYDKIGAQTALFNNGMYVVWTESEMSGGLIFVQKYELTGANLWETPRSYDVAEKYIYLESASVDDSGNLIISFIQFNEDNPIRLMKIDSNGTLLWQNDFIEQESYVHNLELKSCNSGMFYLHYFYSNGLGDYYNYFYKINSEGNICEDWDLPDTSDMNTLEAWEVDDNGFISILYDSANGHLKLQKIDLNGGSVFEQPAIICNAYSIWFCYPVNMQLMSDGRYLCSCMESTVLVSSSGEILWEMNQFENHGFYTDFLIAGEDCFYEISCFNELYQFNYDQELNWNFTLASEEYEILDVVLRTDDGVRLITKSLAEGYYCYNYSLIDYSNNGEMISPANGWYYLQEFSNRYLTDFKSDSLGNIIWTSFKYDEALHQELSFATISESGEFLTGAEDIIVRTGIEQNLKPVELDVATDYEAILMRENAFTTSINNGDRLIYQKLDSNGNPVYSSSGEIVSSGYNQILCRKNNQVLFFCLTAESKMVNLLDMETGNLLWGDQGYEINASEISSISGDIVENTAIIYWMDHGVSWVEGIIAGTSYWGPQIVPFDTPGNPRNQVVVKGRFLINRSANYYQITHLSSSGNLEWYYYFPASGAPHNADDIFYEVPDGLIYIYREAVNGSWEEHCQKVSHLGNPVFGLHGFDINYEQPYSTGGFIRLESGFGIYYYDEEAVFPAKFLSFNNDGEIIQPLCVLEETANREIAAIEGIPEGFVIMLSEPSELYCDLYCAKYDFNGSLSNMGYDNPFICYGEYSHNNAVAINVNNNSLYYAWEVMINDYSVHVSNKGNDVFLQGIHLSSLGNDYDVVCCSSNNLKCYPNPFNPEVTIQWEFLDPVKETHLEIYNLRGQQIRSFNINQTERNSMVWDGTNDKGFKCSSGVYMIKVHNNEEIAVSRVLLLK